MNNRIPGQGRLNYRCSHSHETSPHYVNYLPSGPDTRPGHVTSKTPRYSSSPFFTPRSRSSRPQPKTPASRREPIVHVLCSKPVDRSINTSISLASHPTMMKSYSALPQADVRKTLHCFAREMYTPCFGSSAFGLSLAALL